MAGINRTQIEHEIASGLSGGQREAKAAVERIVEIIQKTLARGERVHITGLGSFTAEKVPPRSVRNPATGEYVLSKKTGKVSFKPSDSLKQIITEGSGASAGSED